MPNATAATKMPPLGPGEFRFVTNSLTAADPGADGPRRFRAIASSTITDLAGNTISLKALQGMAEDFRQGLTIFMDHDYENVVDKAFGSSDSADVYDSGLRDPKTGAPIYDLVISGVVNEPNPRAVQLHDSIKGGYVKFGASIGAIVHKHVRDKATGGMLIDSLTAKEASIVGIPKNQRSWVYKAALAASNLDEDPALADDEEEDEEPAAAVVTGGEINNATVTVGGGLETFAIVGTAPDTTITTTSDVTITSGEGSCPSCKHNAGCDCGECDCSSDYHSTKSSVTDLSETADETLIATMSGGQESGDAETPETAPVLVASTDPEEDRQVVSIETADMATLIAHVESLVLAVGERDREIVELKATLAAKQHVEAEVELTKSAVAKLLEMPLQRKAVVTLEAHLDRFPMYDPRITSYLTNRGNE